MTKIFSKVAINYEHLDEQASAIALKLKSNKRSGSPDALHSPYNSENQQSKELYLTWFKANSEEIAGFGAKGVSSKTGSINHETACSEDTDTHSFLEIKPSNSVVGRIENSSVIHTPDNGTKLGDTNIHLHSPQTKPFARASCLSRKTFLLDTLKRDKTADTHSQEFSEVIFDETISQTPDTLSLGAYVDDYETAYQWAKNWRAEA